MASSRPTGAHRPVRSATPSTGQVVGGRYEVRRRLAGGGEAEALLARDRALDLDVVLKTRTVGDEDDLERMRREAAILMGVVAHRGLPVVRSDLIEGDRYYMISDHVDGRDLHDLVAAQAEAGLPLTAVLDLVDQLAGALDHLHTQHPSVVHGDVKPENVVVTADGRAVLVDFGAAMRLDDDRERFGTPGFSAPEVLAGDPVSAASDIFSIAALTVYLLTGLTPKLGTAWPTAIADSNLARLERVIRRGLTWDPLGRPWSASEFATQLRSAAESEIPTGTITLLLASPIDGAVAPSSSLLTALEAAGGRQVSTVDVPPGQVVVVFSRAGDAAAVALHTAERERVRIVLHAGDLGGWHGATLQQLVNEAVRLGGAIGEVEVACSPPVRMLLGADPTLAFSATSADGVELRRPGESAAPPTGSESPLLRSDHALRWVEERRSNALVGRDRQLRDAALAVDRSRAEARAALVLVTGEAGLGKSRFLAELAGASIDSGELVLVGRCTEAGGAFEVFLDALGDELFPFESGQLERDEEGWIDRKRFFGRIGTAIAEQGLAVTLLLDDIQWIDGSSLALLTQLLDDVGPSLAVLAGCRPRPATDGMQLLQHRPGTHHVSMRPLTAEAFSELAAHCGVELGDESMIGLFALTRGNPFFAMQLIDQVRRSPDLELGDAGLASAARDWMLQRVDRLGAETASTLAIAAVMGDTFDVIVLADVIGTSPLETLGHLEAGHDAGFLVEGDRPGEFSFVHAIVQAILAESLSGARKGLLHAAIARRLEETGVRHEQLEAAMHHWFAADRLGDPLHAGEIAAEVGTRATERLAHERAVSILTRALAVLGEAPPSAQRDRVEARLRVAHGRADFIATRNAEALDQLYRAADLAEQVNDPETLVQAALVASLNRRHGLDDSALLRLLERATDRCPSEPAVLRSMLHIRRSRLLPISVPHEERSAMARLGLADLERMDAVDRAMVETEIARACWTPDDAAARLATSTRIIDEARQQVIGGGPSRWTGVLIEALNLRWAANVQVGQVRAALDDTLEAVAIADQAGTTFLLSRAMMGQAMVRATLGEHGAAERLSSDAIAMSSRHNLVIDQMAIHYAIGRDRGQQAGLAQLEDQLGDLVESNPLLLGAFALVHAEAGQLDDARRLLDDLEAQEPWPRNWVWLATSIAALESAVISGVDHMIERYADALAPFTGQWAIAAAETGCWGPIDRVLGLADAQMGRTDEAHRRLISARDSSLVNGASFWVARCHAGLADLEDSST